jgi:hypothetical protein
MQPILAESAPHRGRAVAFAVALAAFALMAFAPSSHGRHHQMKRIGKCAHSHYSYLNPR